AETDPAKKITSLLSYAGNMNSAGELKNAIVGYRKVLELAPDNVDALGGLGLALYSEGATPIPPDKTVLQEGLNYMQRFVDTAPDTHKLKESTKAIIEELKNEQKLAPQKTTPTKRKG
ncbi:MAG: tetratricopeptide repeat protein, partial [Pyrinomonadaceae bacterium]